MKRNDDLRDQVIALAMRGCSYGQIGAELGMTRCAAGGIVHRAKERGMVFPVQNNKRVYSSATRARSSAKMKLPSLSSEPTPIGPVGDFPTATSCRYISGETGPEFRMCGAPGYPWCDYHKAICYAPPRNRREETE